MICDRRIWPLALGIALALSACVTDRPARTAQLAEGNGTALDRYVHAVDDSYHYELVDTMAEGGVSHYVIDLTSQTWRTADEVNRTEWQHWLSIYVPDTVRYDTGMLYIGGGRNGRDAPNSMSAEFAQMARASESVVAHLGMVPNQPLIFDGDGKERSEDDLIAYTWNKFLQTGDETWPARLPMTKSVVRAMDTVQDFCAKSEAGSHDINAFVVAGGSKRGWTTWTTAAVDDRVSAVVPIVIDLLNIEASFKHHWEAYGFWAPAVGDYEEHGLMNWMGTPEYDALLALVEPYSYIERYTMPKLIMNSAGDQFFLPDSSQFYWDDLPGEKYLRYVPNTGHGLDDSDAFLTLLAFYHSIISDTALPQYDWEIKDDAIVVTTPDKPVEVKFWTATNAETRDFRVDEVGKIWKSTPLEPMSEGTYMVRLQTPPEGWTAQMVELTFQGPDGTPLKYTTPIKVMPETLPFTYTPPADPPKGYLSR